MHFLFFSAPSLIFIQIWPAIFVKKRVESVGKNLKNCYLLILFIPLKVSLIFKYTSRFALKKRFLIPF